MRPVVEHVPEWDFRRTIGFPEAQRALVLEPKNAVCVIPDLEFNFAGEAMLISFNPPMRNVQTKQQRLNFFAGDPNVFIICFPFLYFLFHTCFYAAKLVRFPAAMLFSGKSKQASLLRQLTRLEYFPAAEQFWLRPECLQSLAGVAIVVLVEFKANVLEAHFLIDYKARRAANVGV